MTRYRLDHAAVMDTDDIPGRGGYAVVGVSRGVTQAERLFVAQNFGISDFLHDPQNDRTFYSFFRVPGGRRAFTRRFASGRRRNGTQNRLFVHTLFFDDALFDGLSGLPWLLLEGTVRAEGSDDEWEPLRNALPWVGVNDSMPALEADVDDHVLADVPRRLNARLALAGKDLANAPTAVAALIGALRDRKRVVLPQGRGHEWLTLLAWSMLPRRDREELSWTQHDPLSISGVTFNLANIVAPGTEAAAAVAIDRAAAPIAGHIVRCNTTSAEEWRDFHETAARFGLSIRRSDTLEACLAHRDAIRDVAENIGAPDYAVLEKLQVLAETGTRLRGQPCFEGEGILELLWNNVVRAVEAQQPANLAVAHWASLLHRSGLDEVIFRDGLDRRWLDHAAAGVGPDLLVDFFLRATEGVRDAAAARATVAEWLVANQARNVEAERLARMVVRAYADRIAVRRDLLRHLLALRGGLAALQQVLPVREELAELVYDATMLALDANDAQASTFLREVFLPHVESLPPLAAKVTRELAERVAPLLRDDAEAFLRFQSRVAAETRVRLVEMVTGWVSLERERSLPLARDVMRQLARDPAAAPSAGPLAFALAQAGEPGGLWFGALLHLAAMIDAKDDARVTQTFLADVRLLEQTALRLQGANEVVVAALEKPNVRVGPCMRALVLVARPTWKPQLVEAVTRVLGRTYSSVVAWEPLVIALATDFASRGTSAEVSDLVAQFWEKVPPEDVAQASRAGVDTIALVSSASRRGLVEAWQPRLRRLPESDASQRLLHVLFGSGAGTSARELRGTLAWRKIEQDIASDQTLSELDKALFDAHGPRYGAEMVAATLRYVGDGTPAARVRRLCGLLRASDVAPTVKRIIETTVLPELLDAFEEQDWLELASKARPEELFCRGAATLTLAFEAGRHAGENAIRLFDSACRTERRVDVAESLAAGRRARGLGQRISSWFRRERQPSA